MRGISRTTMSARPCPANLGCRHSSLPVLKDSAQLFEVFFHLLSGSLDEPGVVQDVKILPHKECSSSPMFPP